MIYLFTDRIFSLKNDAEFAEAALDLFRYQAGANKVYNQYLSYLKIRPSAIDRVEAIPFLPAGFFRTHRVISGNIRSGSIFASSGTTGHEQAKHYVKNISLYEKSSLTCFESFYGKIRDYCILALTPSYRERKDSSLVYMLANFIRRSKHPKSGFYLNEPEKLQQVLSELEESGQKSLLIGLSYALLGFAEKYPLSLKKAVVRPRPSDTPPESGEVTGTTLIVMETGGMKGKRKDLTRSELHEKLKQVFGVSEIHSEYGMTELLSQAYAVREGKFRPPPWLRIFIRDIYDPFSLAERGKTGGVNIIDLANIHSCAFIQTDDLGKLNDDGTFEISGRIDSSDVRGCNLMIE